MVQKHECLKEADIAELKTDTKRISKAVEGNGHEGLIIVSVRLEESVKGLQTAVMELRESMLAFRTMASGYDKFQIEYSTMKIAETRHELNRKWMVRTIIMMGTFLTAALVAIFKK